MTIVLNQKGKALEETPVTYDLDAVKGEVL